MILTTMLNALGYNKNLFILPFDHRGSLEKEFKKETISDLKNIIYEAFKRSLITIPKDDAAILVDEQYGDFILRDARSNGLITILTVEKSGQEGFEFEYGEQFAQHIEKYQPTFVKALIRYQPGTNWSKLKILSDYCHRNNYKFLLEVLLGSQNRSQAIDDLHKADVEPDVWKMEGMENAKDYEDLIAKITQEERKDVGLVVLGRAESEEQVERWIRAGRSIKGVIGFAVGRTIFLEPLKMLRDGKIDRRQVVEIISNKFVSLYDLFTRHI